MKVIIVGLPYFAKKIIRDLSEFAPQHTYRFYNTYYSKWHQVKFAAMLPFADIVISMNGVSDKSGSLDLVLKMRKKLWLQWQGTDVLLAVERSKNNTIDKKYIDYAVNYTDATWMKDELKSIKIECELLQFKWLNIPILSKKYTELSAYSYLPKGKENFYGWKIIFHLAERNPDIPFYIAGTNGDGLQITNNIIFLGWIPEKEMCELRDKTPICLRLPQHDGYSLTVIEALSCGNEVIWTMPHEQCHLLKNIKDTEMIFEKVVDNLRKRNLLRNENNILFVKNNFSREEVLGNFLKIIKKVVSK